MHMLAIIVVCYLILHFAFASHRYRNSRHHRSFLHRCWISLPGPFGFRLGHRL